MKTYMLLEANNAEALELLVNEKIEEGKGWKPCGGVAVSVLRSEWENERKGYTEHETEWRHTQAMCR